MTQKELAYLEDACSHEQIIVSIIEESLNNLEDEKLVEFMKNELDKHNNIKQNLLNLLEEKANE